jgi:hypothetical protein
MAWIKLNATSPAAPEGARNVHFRQEAGHSGAQSDPIPTAAYLEDLPGIPLGGVDARTGTTETIDDTAAGKLITFSNADPVAVTLDLAGAESLARAAWIASASSVYGDNPAFGADKAIDDDLGSMWISGGYSASLMINLGAALTFNRLTFLPRQDGYADRPGAVELYVSDDGLIWGAPIATATWANDASLKVLDFVEQTAAYVKLVMAAASEGSSVNASCAEFNLYAVQPVEIFVCAVKNLGAGAVTVTPASGLIDAEADLELVTGESAWLFFDGDDWWTL